MSALFFAELQRLKAQVDELAHKNRILTERVEMLEAESHSHSVEVDTLEPKRGPGRPRRAA
jgi:hypothetical protein